MIEDGFTKLCRVDDLKDRTGKRFMIDDIEVALFKIDDKIYALNNICPHQHSALIYDGFIEDGCIVCPVHGWKFNLETGLQPGGKSGLDSYPVKIISGEIYVKVFNNKFKW